MFRYIKETGRKGFITYTYQGRYLYSVYDPALEARKYLTTLGPLKKEALTCCGADYINIELLNQNIERIISFEPAAFEPMIHSPRIIRIPTIEALENFLLQEQIHAQDLSLIFWQPLLTTNPDLFLPAIKRLKDTLYKSSFSANTAKAFGLLEIINLLHNTRLCSKLTLLTEQTIPFPLPAVILSSGASLAGHTEFIKRIAKQAVLFALPSSLPFLAHHQIIPDFAIAADPGYATVLHLIRYPAPLRLIAPLTIHPAVLSLPQITPLFFSYDSPLELMFYAGQPVIHSPAEGTVFMNCLRILKQLGFSEAVIFGQDFGFYAHRSHVKAGSFEAEFLARAGYFSPFETLMVHFEKPQTQTVIEAGGKVIPTHQAFKLYFEHFISLLGNQSLPEPVLPADCYNPLSNRIKKITPDDFKGYSLKSEPFVLNLSEWNITKDIKKNILSGLKKLYDALNHPGSTAQILQEFSVNPAGKKGIKRFDKIYRNYLAESR